MATETGGEHPGNHVGSDSSREATDSVRGYDWQRWLTVLAWLRLAGEDSLWIEWAEDFTVTNPAGGGFTVQAKDRGGSISLGQKNIQEILSNAWARPSNVRTWVWTSAQAGNEQGLPLGEPGIDYWQKAIDRSKPLGPLRRFLSKAKNFSPELKNRIGAATDEALLAMLGQIGWAVGESDVGGLRQQVLGAVEARMTALGIRNASLSREVTAALLIDTVARRGILEKVTERRLTRVGLDQDLARWHRERLDGAAPEILAKLGADRLALQRVDRKAAREAPPWGYSWFVYTSETIPMIGREAEAAKLQAFADHPAPFLWWAIGGAGGLGKSRLVQEAMSRLGDGWTRGFSRIDQLPQLLGDISLQTNDILVAIDYAAVDSKAVSTFLMGCLELATAARRIRVLLIDRDPSMHAEWWRTLLPPFSAQAATLEGVAHATPLLLEPLLNDDRQVLEAWLNAGREAARPEPALWGKIHDLCGGNPLLLGFAAAAIARGDMHFDSIADLLGGLTFREWTKVRERTPDEVKLTVATDMIATATLMRRPLFEYADDDSIVLFTKDEEGKMSVLLLTKTDGKKRLPTFGELDAGLLPPGIVDDLLEERRVSRAGMAALVAPYELSEAFSAAHSVFGAHLIVQPDLLGEYFLARSWQATESRLRPSPIPVFQEERFDRQLRVAWHISPLGTSFTLEQLRQHPWAIDGFLHAVTRLSALITEADDAGAVDQFSKMLFNASSRIGGDTSPLRARRKVYAALDELHRARPNDEGVIYRRNKAFKQMLNLLEGKERDLARRTYVLESIQLIALMVSRKEQQELHFMDVVDQLRLSATEVLHVSDTHLVLQALEGLATSGIETEEVLRKMGACYFGISSACARPDQVPGEESVETLEYARSIRARLAAGAQLYATMSGPFSAYCREISAKTIVNVSLAMVKLRDWNGVYPLAELALQLSFGGTSAIRHQTNMHAFYNVAAADMARDDVEGLERTMVRALHTLAPAIDDVAAVGIFLQALDRAVAFAFAGRHPVVAIFLLMLLSTPWPIANETVRRVLFRLLRYYPNRVQTELIELSLEQSLPRNPSRATIAFVENALVAFDPTAKERENGGLYEYLEAIKRADLGVDLEFHLALGIAAFWGVHDRVPTLENSPIKFWLRPEPSGVRVTFGDNEHDRTRWHFFELERMDLRTHEGDSKT